MNRRSFLAALAGLPFVGKLFGKAEVDHKGIHELMVKADARIRAQTCQRDGAKCGCDKRVSDYLREMEA